MYDEVCLDAFLEQKGKRLRRGSGPCRHEQGRTCGCCGGVRPAGRQISDRGGVVRQFSEKAE